MRVSSSNILHKIWLIITIITIFYSFFFQYGVKSINGLMMVLCMLIIACGIIHVFLCDKGILYKSMLRPFILFVITAVISTIITSHGNYGTYQSVRMIEYIMVAYSVYLLITRFPEYLNSVMWSFVLSIALLSASVITKGVVSTSSGGVGLASLNINTMSSYILFAFFASFYILLQKHRKIIVAFLWLINLIYMITLIAGASRRGFVVGVLMILSSIFFVIIPSISKNKSYRRFVLSAVFVIILGVISYFAFDYILNNTSLGHRLMGINNDGDNLRERYQTFAIQSFFDNPLFGIGLGGVEYHMGAYSHSLYYETLACTGIISSLFLYYGFIKYFFYIRKIRSIYVRSDDNESEAIDMLVAIFLLSILLSGIAVVMIYELYFYFALSIIAIILTNISNKHSDTESDN